MKKRLYIFIIVTILLTSQLYSYKNTASGIFINIPATAKNISLGNSITASGDSVNSIYLNPAGLISIKHIETVFSMNKWLFDTYLFSAGAGYNLKNSGVIGISSKILSLPTLENKYYTTEKFNNSSFNITLSYAKNLKNLINIPVSAGINSKFLYEKLADVSASSMLFDIGVITTILNNFNFGVSINNLGLALKFDTYENSAPTVINSGISYEYDLKAAGFLKYFNTSLNFNIPLYSNFEINLGEEIMLKNISNGLNSAIRFGIVYPRGNFINMLSFGIGIMWKNINFDYAFADVVEDIGFTHTFSFGMKF